MITKRLVCLANSRKLNGRCVAGVEFVGMTPQGWIRPVSDREHGEVSRDERQYSDGADPQVLDVIDVPLREHRPWLFQQENWLLDPEHYWAWKGTLDWPKLAAFAVVDPLWVNGHSTYNGHNDKVPLSVASGLNSSLMLIHADAVKLVVFASGEAFGKAKRRVQARFRHAGNEYWLWVTDPRYERSYLARPDGTYDLGEAYLTVSLGEPMKEDCFKLVAAIIERETIGGPS
jgi:hypothetical protein